MSRHQKRRDERAETISEDTLYGYVFAEVAAWQQEMWVLCDYEDVYAEAITDQLDHLRTGLTRAERREAIRNGVGNYMDDVISDRAVPSAVR